VVKVADKDGTKTYGMFLSMPNQRMTPTKDPVVMFKETAAGAPPAIQVWFYPGETYGYEFAYPHDQALKIAKATHQPVLSYTDHSTASTTDEERMASMRSAEVSRIDENDKPVSSDEALKQSSEARTAAASPTATTTASSTATTTASPTATTTAPRTATTTAPRTAASARSQSAVGTTGSTSDAAAAPPPVRKHLPRTASELPLLALIATLSLAGGFGLRLARLTL
jgi:hypothetical protein